MVLVTNLISFFFFYVLFYLILFTNTFFVLVLHALLIIFTTIIIISSIMNIIVVAARLFFFCSFFIYFLFLLNSFQLSNNIYNLIWICNKRSDFIFSNTLNILEQICFANYYALVINNNKHNVINKHFIV